MIPFGCILLLVAVPNADGAFERATAQTSKLSCDRLSPVSTEATGETSAIALDEDLVECFSVI